MKPKAVSLLCVLLAALLLGACAHRGGTAVPGGSPTPSAAQSAGPGEDGVVVPPSGDRLIVHFFDVGKGDSILVQQGDASMLIDGGPVDQGEAIAQAIRVAGVDTLQQVVVTHSDSDHVGGVEQILSQHKPLAFIMPMTGDEGKDYQHLIKAVGKMGLEIAKPVPGDTFDLGAAKVTVLAPNRSDYADLDDFSVVLKVVFGKTSFLFTGDASEQSETDMLMHNYDLSATVLKVGHHGQNDASTTALLNAVHPAAAVISDSIDQGAAKKVLQRLADVGADVYRTSQAGTVVATSDGQTVTFNVAPSPPEKQKGKGK